MTQTATPSIETTKEAPAVALPEKEELVKLRAENEKLKAENKELRDLFDAQDFAGAALSALSASVSRPGTFEFSGRVGGPFSIDGKGFGDDAGLVILNNVPVMTSRWRDDNIKGMVPSNFKRGPITVIVNGVRLTKTLS